ncbi:MAG TPA: hypothetical protein VG293_11560 [Solirubrobacteraceae bacterium]|nr:hypothetical protein [Solirubrobacteraceae bacterium]
MIFAVTLARGGPWDWSCGLREQQGFEQHGRFMDALVDDGFILLGGPLALEREVLHIVRADSEDEVRRRLAGDLWHQNGMLTVSSIRSWTVLLDGLGATAPGAER